MATHAVEAGALMRSSDVAGKLLLKQVFTPGGQPSITYVSRDHLGLEKRVADALARGFAINVVTGPTKSGKTVLCNHVLGQVGESVTVEGGQVRSETDFWAQIVHALDLGNQRVRKESGSTAETSGWNGSLGIPKALAIGGKKEKGQTRSTERSISYDVVPQQAALNALVANSISLLVDDFHYIPQDVQKAIIQSLKGAVFKGLSVILLAVPHRAFDPLTVEQELEGRFKHIEIPSWELADLLLIPQRGFEALDVQSTETLNETICAEGFGNPLLVQEICSELCLKSGIREKLPTTQS